MLTAKYDIYKNTILKIFNRISRSSLICLSVSLTIMAAFFIVQSCIVFGWCKPSYNLALFGYACVILFTPPFFVFISEFLKSINKNEYDLLEKVMTKNTYLEHAAKILRHDMHSGINTYLPRGVRSLERRLNEESIKNLKLESPLKLIKEGLEHSQTVYKGIFEFTNLVREDSKLTLEKTNLKELLESYLRRTSYSDQVLIEDLPTIEVNPPLFCTAIDNLIRNGLKYNDSQTKLVQIRMLDNNTLGIQDNGRGMSQEQFLELSKPYTRKQDQKENGTGLGLNICIAILKEHNFKIKCKKLPVGTLLKIGINNEWNN